MPRVAPGETGTIQIRARERTGALAGAAPDWTQDGCRLVDQAGRCEGWAHRIVIGADHVFPLQDAQIPMKTR